MTHHKKNQAFALALSLYIAVAVILLGFAFPAIFAYQTDLAVSVAIFGAFFYLVFSPWIISRLTPRLYPLVDWLNR